VLGPYHPNTFPIRANIANRVRILTENGGQ
jgi:hypothetical protein